MPVLWRFPEVEVDRKAGFIDRAGRFAVEPRFDSAMDVSEDLAPVSLDEAPNSSPADARPSENPASQPTTR